MLVVFFTIVNSIFQSLKSSLQDCNRYPVTGQDRYIHNKWNDRISWRAKGAVDRESYRRYIQHRSSTGYLDIDLDSFWYIYWLIIFDLSVLYAIFASSYTYQIVCGIGKRTFNFFVYLFSYLFIFLALRELQFLWYFSYLNETVNAVLSGSFKFL